LSLSNPEIVELIEQFEKETKAVRSNILEICWHMRGSISYEDGMLLSFSDREMISKIIKDHMDTTEKTRLPFF
jgi:hypothetical protein